MLASLPQRSPTLFQHFDALLLVVVAEGVLLPWPFMQLPLPLTEQLEIQLQLHEV